MSATTAATRVRAVGSPSVRRLIGGAVRPATVLGAFPTALYLRLPEREVVALLSRDAIRLPCGLVLPTASSEFPLSRLEGQALVGASAVRVGELNVWLSHLVSPCAPTGLTADHQAVEHAWRRLVTDQSADLGLGLPGALLRDYQRPRVAASLVDRLLGVGPGLTPAGDDVLAGLLVGARSFGLDADALTDQVLGAATHRTTDLSTALLRCACRGEATPELRALVSALAGGTAHRGQLDDALAALRRVGHTSGEAMATGATAAATVALAHAGRGPA